MAENKNKILAIVIVVVVVGASIGLYYAFGPKPESPPEGPIFKYGTGSGPIDLDPQYAWDSASIDVIDQVCEGLFAYDLSDPNLPIVPRLAADAGTWSADAKNLTVNLKPNVLFHDGTNMTADDVVFTFDRLNFFLNATGTLTSDPGKTQIHELYEYYDAASGSMLPIINQTVKVSDTQVKFVLNTPYAPFKALLCFSGSYILSSNAGSTPQNTFYNINSDKLIGTGPFRYIRYATDDEVVFWRFANYHAGAAPMAQVIFDVIEDSQSRNQALLSGDVDLLASPLPSMLDTFKADTGVTVVEGGKNLIIQYIGFNNKIINQTMRQAISWAINYTYILEEIMDNQAVRLKSPVPDGILYSRTDLNVPTYDVAQARQILINAGIAPAAAAGWTDAQWIAMAQNNPFATFNYTFNTDNEVRTDIGYLLANNTQLIGIQTELEGQTWEEYIYRLFDIGEYSRDQLAMYFIGWAPDYNDPSNFLNPLFSNTSASNSAQVNDPTLQTLLVQGLEETDPTQRELIYNNTQQYIVETLMPWALVYQGINTDAYRADITGYYSNTMGKVWFHSVNRTTT